LTVKKRSKGKALRRRYGRTWASESAITVPVAHGLYDVVIVDNRGTVRRALRRGVPYSVAVAVVRRTHG
jgi:hypothetical protein